jgi:hypothetical protein
LSQEYTSSGDLLGCLSPKNTPEGQKNLLHVLGVQQLDPWSTLW